MTRIICSGLGLLNEYANRISVQSNPIVDAELNEWMIEYNGESSKRFPGNDTITLL